MDYQRKYLGTFRTTVRAVEDDSFAPGMGYHFTNWLPLGLPPIHDPDDDTDLECWHEGDTVMEIQ